MSKSSMTVRGAGFTASFWVALDRELRKRGVSDAAAYDALKDGSPLIAKFADLIAGANNKQAVSGVLTVDYSVKPSLVDLEVIEHTDRTDTATIELAKVERAVVLKHGENYVGGEENLKRLRATGKILLDVRVMEGLLKQPGSIPEEWKSGYTYFWGTIFRDADGHRFVAYLFWVGKRWRWDFDWLDVDWHSGCPAACLASEA